MPLYEYECQACGKRFELIQKFSDPPAEVCRLCSGGPVQRLLSSPAIQFKGSGWYITDYADKGKSSTATPASTSTGSSSSTEGASASTPATPSTSSDAPSK